MDHRRSYDVEGLNVGQWPDVAADRLISPVGRFFRRNHAAIPDIDAAAWRLELDGLVERPSSYSLAGLTARFPRRTVTATVVCAGLRRAEFLALGPLPGELPWGPDAASTGEWSGIALADVLRSIGVAERARHVELVGLDRVTRRGQEFGFGGSIDVAKAMSEEVILATHLNGEPLPPAHGFPLRAVVPGWIGARSVKWLGRINLLADPSHNYFQAKAYRVQREVNPADPLNVSKGAAMDGVPLNAVIADPAPGAVVPAGTIRLSGWAIGSECRPLTTIEVATDRTMEWVRAKTLGAGDRWTWSYWEATVPLVPGSHVLLVRASDESGTMPATVQETWNVKGYGGVGDAAT